MIEFLEHRWYWIVGGVIGLYVAAKLFGRSSSAGANVSTPAGTSVVYGGTNANDAAVQVAQLNSQSQLAGAQIAAGVAVQQAQIAEAATASTNAAGVSIAGIAADAAKVASTNATHLGIVQSGNGATVAIAQANDAYLLGSDTNAANLKALENTNAAKLAAYGIQATVVNNQTTAAQTVALASSNNSAQVQLAYLADATRLKAQQMSTQAQQYNTLLANPSFDLKSQHGGANAVAALAAVENPQTSAVASLGASSADAQINKPADFAAIIAAIGSAAKSGLSAVFA